MRRNRYHAGPNADPPAGFWLRFAALWIDGAIAWLCAYALVLVFRHFHAYLPLELTFLSLLVGTSALLVAWHGRTVGKMLCGLRVVSSRNELPGCLQGLLRETLAKLVSGTALFLGFFWVVFSPKKRAWHDLLAKTAIVQSPLSLGRGRWVLGLALGASLLLCGPIGYETVMLAIEARTVAAYVTQDSDYSHRDPTTLTDVSSLSGLERGAFAEWLTKYGEDPREYVLDAARQHAVTIIGERHWLEDELAFLNAIIGDLYHRAGVTCIAMEACAAKDNSSLLQLVTAREFDRPRALEIARNQGWATWGWKGYWDVLESVWRLNGSLPAGAKKMRVVGIDTDWDGPSFALLGLGDDGVTAPCWEKLRLLRVAGDVVKLAKRDELMARNVEREILDKAERGIVWVGSAHSFLDYRSPSVVGGKLVGEWPRMSVMLRQKHGAEVFQILLHDDLFNPSIAGVIEEAVRRGPRPSVAFSVVGSPIAKLRDRTSRYFEHQPGACFEDMAKGYIFLKPLEERRRCDWIEGFITTEMFVRNKPYYEAVCGRTLANAAEADHWLGRR